MFDNIHNDIFVKLCGSIPIQQYDSQFHIDTANPSPRVYLYARDYCQFVEEMFAG